MTASSRLSRVSLVDGADTRLWDESDNPAGSHKYRAAKAVVEAAVRDNGERIVVGSCGNYGIAVALAAMTRPLRATVVIPCSAEALAPRLKALGAEAVVVDGGYEDAVFASRSLALVLGAADGNVDGPYAQVAREALGRSALELLFVLRGAAPATLWVPLGNGTTVVAMSRALQGAGTSVPVLGVTAKGHNSVLASWPSGKHAPLPPDAVSMSDTRAPLVNWDALDGQDALDVLHSTDGAALGVDDPELEKAASCLRDSGIPVSPSGAAAVAGMMAHQGWLGSGVNVALLTGRLAHDRGPDRSEIDKHRETSQT